MKPVVLLDLEELEILMGLVGEGDGIVNLLERTTSPLWLERDFKAMVSEEYGQRGSSDAAFVSQERGRAFKAIKRALDLAVASSEESAQAA